MLAALGLSALALGPVASAQAVVTPTTSSWTGAGTPGAGTGYRNWSDPANWSGSAVPAAGNALNFPMPASPCASGTPCNSNNNLTAGTAFSGLTIDSSANYDLTGNPIALTGPITSTTSHTSGPSNSMIEFPVSLGSTAGQWSITGGIGTPSTGDVPSGLSFNGVLTGTATLGVALAHEAQLSLNANNELGAVTFSGGPVDPAVPAANNGTVALGQNATTVPASLNGTNGNPVNVDNAALDTQSNTASPITTGALSLQRGSLSVGNPSGAAGGVSVNGGVTIDSASDTTFYVNHTAAVARTDYSQLSASGNVALDGALTLRYGSDCATAASPGTAYTLVTTTTGTVSGTFAGGRFATVVGWCSTSNTDIVTPVRLDYSLHAVTATVLSGSTTTLTAPSSATTTNRSVTLTATVNPGGGTPTGTIAFVNYGRPIAGCDSQPVSGGTATCTTQTLVGAQQHLTAVFSPDTSSTVGGSRSSEVVYTVNPDATTTALTASSSNVTPGSKVTYTATVTPADSGPNQPNQWGAVQFADHGTPIDCGTGHSTYGEPMNAGNTATCVVTYPAAGSHSITAAYAQDDYAFSSSKSVAQSITVAAPAPAPAPTPAPAPAPAPKPAPAPAPAPAGTGTPHIGTPAVHGTSVAVPVSCAKGGPSCHITAKLIAVKALRGPKVIAVAPGTKITHTAILVGTATTTVKAGQHTQVRVKLNGSGRRLLAKDHGLKVKMTISRKVKGGKSSTVASTTVTFRAITKQKKSRKKR